MEYSQPDFGANSKGKIPNPFARAVNGRDVTQAGVTLLGLNNNSKQSTDPWFYRKAPTFENGRYTPASKHKAIKVKGVSAAPKVSVKTVTEAKVKMPGIPVAKGLVYSESRTPNNVRRNFVSQKGNITTPGTYRVWRPANDNGKTPASAKTAPITLS